MLDYETKTLIGVVDALELFGLCLRKRDSWTSPAYRSDPRRRSYAWELVNCGMPYSPRDWTEEALTAADRQRFTRAVDRLCKQRLLVRVERFCHRLTHLQLTPRGLAVGIRVAEKIGEAVDLRAVKKALAVCEWATKEHREALAALRPKEAPAP